MGNRPDGRPATRSTANGLRRAILREGVWTMGRDLARRLLSVIPTVFGISVVVFLSVHLVPGDAADVLLGTSRTPQAAKALRELFGLDRPLYVQYWVWLGDVLHGDFGRSLRTGQPVLHMIAVRFPTTLELTVAAMLVSL